MGVADRWPDRTPGRMPSWRGRDDRNGQVQRRSRWMLIAGSALLLVAMMVARSLPNRPGSSDRFWREIDGRRAETG